MFSDTKQLKGFTSKFESHYCTTRPSLSDCKENRGSWTTKCPWRRSSKKRVSIQKKILLRSRMKGACLACYQRQSRQAPFMRDLSKIFFCILTRFLLDLRQGHFVVQLPLFSLQSERLGLVVQ